MSFSQYFDVSGPYHDHAQGEEDGAAQEWSDSNVIFASGRTLSEAYPMAASDLAAAGDDADMFDIPLREEEEEPRLGDDGLGSPVRQFHTSRDKKKVAVVERKTRSKAPSPRKTSKPTGSAKTTPQKTKKPAAAAPTTAAATKPKPKAKPRSKKKNTDAEEEESEGAGETTKPKEIKKRARKPKAELPLQSTAVHGAIIAVTSATEEEEEEEEEKAQQQTIKKKTRAPRKKARFDPVQEDALAEEAAEEQDPSTPAKQPTTMLPRAPERRRLPTLPPPYVSRGETAVPLVPAAAAAEVKKPLASTSSSSSAIVARTSDSRVKVTFLKTPDADVGQDFEREGKLNGFGHVSFEDWVNLPCDKENPIHTCYTLPKDHKAPDNGERRRVYALVLDKLPEDSGRLCQGYKSTQKPWERKFYHNINFYVRTNSSSGSRPKASSSSS
jgi:hypothetical protein